MGKSRGDKGRRQSKVHMPLESPVPASASASKMPKFETPEHTQYTRPPEDNTLKKRPRKSFLQQEIDGDDLKIDERSITKSFDAFKESFEGVPNPTPMEVGYLLASRLDRMQGRFAHHLDEVDGRIKQYLAHNNRVLL